MEEHAEAVTHKPLHSRTAAKQHREAAPPSCSASQKKRSGSPRHTRFSSTRTGGLRPQHSVRFVSFRAWRPASSTTSFACPNRSRDLSFRVLRKLASFFCFRAVRLLLSFHVHKLLSLREAWDKCVMTVTNSSLSAHVLDPLFPSFLC